MSRLESDQNKPRVDTCYGDEMAHHLRQELAIGNWRGPHQFLEHCTNWDERDFFVGVLSDWPDRPEWLDLWVKEQASSSTAWLMRGAHSVRWAWQARGGGTIDTVSSEGYRVFLQRLKAAEQDLFQSIKLNPEDPTPWAHLLTTARGLQLEITVARDRFVNLLKRHPLHRSAYSLMLQMLCKKWSGSHEEMFKLARYASSKAPHGHGLHTLLVEAHLERWIYDLDGRGDIHAYFQSPQVIEEILAAAERSIYSPQYQPGYSMFQDRNYFAFSFWLMKRFDLAREQFEIIGPYVSKLPWGFADDPAALFIEVRNKCRRG